MHFWWIFIFLYILSLNIIDVYMYDDWWGQTKYVAFNSAKLQFVICLVNKNMLRKPIVYQKSSLSVHHSQIEIRATVYFSLHISTQCFISFCLFFPEFSYLQTK